MKKRLTKIILFITLLLFVIPILLWTGTIYLDLYPRLRDVKIEKPTFGELFQNFAGHKRRCKDLRWVFTGYVDDSSFTVRQYYIDKWKQEPSPGVTQESGLSWDSYSLFELSNEEYGIFVYKNVLYFPDRNISPFKYGVSTDIYLCKLDNWQLPE